jgi:hypothetical protein
MAINPTSFPMPAAFSGGVDFSPLANLGNVYRQGQQQAAQQQTLAQLGNDPDVNNQLMIKSGVPELVTQGLRGQQQQREYALQKAQDKRAAAAEARAQGNYDEAERNEKDAQAIFARIARQPAQQPVQQPPSPFPSPTTAPQGVPVMAQGPDQTPASLSDRFAAVSGPAGGAIPGNLPPSLAPIAAAPAAASLQTPQVASGAISREDLAAMARNPLTRPLALDYLKKQVEDQKPIAAKEGERFYRPDPNRPGQLMDVTPGGAGPSKEERETQGYYQAGLNLNMTPEQARAFAANKGKMPKEELSAKQLSMVGESEKAAQAAQTVIDNIARLKQLSPTAYSGAYASGRADLMSGVLPQAMVPGSVTDTQELRNITTQNIGAQAKAMFGARITNLDLNLLKEIETTPEMTDTMRQRVYDRISKQMQQRVNEENTRADQIRAGTYGKPGGGIRPGGAPTETPAPTAPAAPSGAKPTLQEFMVKARAANPGARDSELAQYWKQKYGG